MAGIHGLQQIECLGTANLANDDALGTHTKTVSHEVAHRDLAFALEVRRSRLQSHDMRLLQLQFRRVFTGDDPLIFVDTSGKGNSNNVVLPEPVPPGHDHVASNTTDHFQDLLASR